MDTDRSEQRILARHINRTVRLTFVGLVVERFVQAFLWFGVFACLVCALVLFGAFAQISDVAWFVALFAIAFGLVFLLWSGGKRLSWPTRSEARARVDATLPNKPLQALDDLTVVGKNDPQTQALWRAHQSRMSQQALRARAIGPHLRMSDRDPFGVRLIAITALIMALLFGTGPARYDGVGAGDDVALGPPWEGWIEPPAHTGKPTLYLADMPATFMAPQNSKVIIRLYGTEDDVKMRQTVSAVASSDIDLERDFSLDQDGEIEISGDAGRVWTVALLPDTPPAAALIGDMTRAASGELRQAFELSDDFGVARAQLEIALDHAAIVSQYGYQIEPEPRSNITLSIPMPRASKRHEIEGMVVENMSLHPFSGLPVQVRLRVWDTAGHENATAQSRAVLPGRKFFYPMAAALIDVRRELLWNRENATRAAQVIRAVSYAQDESYGGDHRLFLRLRSVAGLVEARGPDMSNAVLDNVAETLWDIAVDLEDGELAEALERLRRAQERLAQAMRDGATPEEIAKLMQDLREATQDYLRQRAEQIDDTDNQDEVQSEDSLDVTADQLQQLMDRIQELMEQGRMAEAQQLMEMLNELLENMQVTKGQGQGQGAEAVEGLQEMLREQQQLNDETFSELQKQFDGESDNLSEQSQPSETPDALADRQQTLGDQTQRQGRELPQPAPGQDGDAASELEDAQRSMQDAEDALRDEDYAGALADQARAMEALREGLQALEKQLAQSQGFQGENNAEAQPSESRSRDPLGRSDDGDQGTNESVSGEGFEDQAGVYRRAEELLGEIRRRAAQRERADDELDYLNRLLERF